MKKLKNWFIGDYLAKTEDVFERSKIELLYNYSIAYFLLGSLFYTGLILRGLWYHVCIVSFAVFALASIPFVLKYTHNLKKTSHWFVFMQIFVSCCSIFVQQGKSDITSGFWSVLFILLAFFLYGRNWGIILILISALLSGTTAQFSKLVDIPVTQQMGATPDVIFFPLLLIIIVVWMFIKSRTDSEEHIKKQALLLESSKKELETRNKDITDSINYAKRIQYAVLPQEETIYRSIPLSFIFYKPKDIVSGDFFWFHEINKDEYILVCADCTGHGVPGAFMTVIGSSLLNQTVIDNKIFSPSQILLELDKLINFTLKQQKDNDISVQDGMDITLIKVNTARQELIITSAKRPVLFVRNKELQEVKASKFSIGGMRSGEKTFTETLIKYEEDDILYLFTDGYVDQFGGEKAKKFSSKRLRELLLEIHKLPMSEQKNNLAKTIADWQGNLEQIDDMLVMGIKF